MSRRDASLLLQDMRESMQKIARYVAGMDRAAFLADEKTVDAVVRNVEIIGEASKQLPDDFRACHPQVPWTQMAGMRNRIVHDYAGGTWSWCGMW
ncbi:DUF86 domain-containing protein [Prosthecobacter sp.]|uniref:DUF86 domain-containing protein n=1 Tax=Prosthecobacter sp. TaxID=1965333 RepID=UPI0037838E48